MAEEYLLGELDVVEDDKGSFDVEHRAVVDSWGDVVIAGRSGSVDNVVSHFTRIVCCFSCKLLKSASTCG